MPQPYLTFDGQTAEALAFYAEALGGEVLFGSPDHLVGGRGTNSRAQRAGNGVAAGLRT